MTFTPAEREAADRLSRSGVRVFAEFCQYLGAVNCPNVESTRYARPVSRFRYGEIIEGDILDEQCNTRVVHFYASESRIPLLSYRANPEGFYTLKNYADAEFPVSADALWTEHDTLLFCTFRLADFAKACFAPRKKWFSLIGFILLWLTGEKHDLSFLDAYYAQNAYSTTPCEGTDVELARAAERAMDWHEKGGFLLPPDENGCRAVLEGVGAAVLPDGMHSALHNYTTVSTGETALAYYLQSLYTGDDDARRISDELLASGRRHIADAADETDGWGRSGDNAWWNVCYQDDDARGLLFPRLLRALYGEALPDADAVRRNLDFLLRTTGTDGCAWRAPSWLMTESCSCRPSRLSRTRPARANGAGAAAAHCRSPSCARRPAVRRARTTTATIWRRCCWRTRCSATKDTATRPCAGWKRLWRTSRTPHASTARRRSSAV